MLLSKVIPLVSIFASGAWAQFSSATCGSGFDWNKNSLGQDPCTVGSMLDASCRGLSLYTYPPLNASQYYLPPQTNHSGDLTCDCNTVMYSIYMACASCQEGEVYPWTSYTTQCTSVYISQYPVDIAQGTAIPNWAFYNWTTAPNETFSSVLAQSAGDEPETFPKQISTVATSSTSPGKSTSTKTSNGLPAPTNTNSNSNTNGKTKGKTNVGAIVGGVVGSIVPLTVLGVVIFLYMRNRQRQPQQQMMPTDDDPYKQRPISNYGPPMASVPFTPYNPSDPSTFPPQSPPSSVTYTTTPTNPATRGGYAGMPEV